MTKFERIRKMRRALLRWFRAHGRDLPWRRTGNPYHILVSEVMLQQTQVDRVIPKYHAFLKRFPTWETLAVASQADVVRMWHGLGYNRRALNLHRLARILSEHGAHMPKAHDALVTLPGIGEYTAEAIRAFAFHAHDAAPVDTNIERVLKRVFAAHQKGRAAMHALAREVLPRDTWSWNHALMDLGATICTARKPSCAACPLRLLCASYPCAGDDIAKRPQAKFEGSDRMYRGRMIARLRGKAYDVDTLRILVGLSDEERFGRLVDSLLHEGFLKEKGGKLYLVS